MNNKTAKKNEKKKPIGERERKPIENGDQHDIFKEVYIP